MGCINATYEANPSNSRRAMERTPPKILMTHVNLTLDLLTWEWYMTHRPLMGCIRATYEVNPSNSRRVMTQTRHVGWTDSQMNGQSRTNISNLPPHPHPHSHQLRCAGAWPLAVMIVTWNKKNTKRWGKYTIWKHLGIFGVPGDKSHHNSNVTWA